MRVFNLSGYIKGKKGENNRKKKMQRRNEEYFFFLCCFLRSIIYIFNKENIMYILNLSVRIQGKK